MKLDDPDRIIDALKAVTRLIDQGIPGVVIGGIAASILGTPRFTSDVDAVLMPPVEDIDQVLRLAAGCGLVPRIQDAAAFASRRRVLLMRHAESGTDVDLSLGALPFEHEMIERARTVESGGLRIPLPTPEDLVIMKAVAHRPIDLADIEAVLTSNPTADLRRIRRWTREFAEVLDTPEIVDDLERAIKRARTMVPRTRRG